MSELIATFGRLKVARNFGTAGMAEDYFRSLDYETWMGQIDEMNAAMRGLHKWSEDRGPRNNNVYVEVPNAPREKPVGNVLYIPPFHGDIEALHQRSFHTAQALPDIKDGADLQYITHNLTQRYWNGNVRTAGLVRALLTVGYDNTGVRARRHFNGFYNTLAKGRKGLQRLGLEMDLSHLQRSYALSEIDEIRQHYDYDYIVPTGVAPFRLSTLRAMQPNMASHNVTHTAHLFAEPFMNVPLTTRYMLSAGMRVMDYTRRNPAGDGFVIDVPRLMHDIDLSHFDTLHSQDNLRKSVFVNSIIEAFQGRNFTYGRDHKELLSRLDPRAGRTA